MDDGAPSKGHETQRVSIVSIVYTNKVYKAVYIFNHHGMKRPSISASRKHKLRPPGRGQRVSEAEGAAWRHVFS